MILGTVQLGLEYGIHNGYGKPDLKQGFALLECAEKNGIRLLDTAEAYGDSQKVIGQYIAYRGQSFGICTKLSLCDEGGVSVGSTIGLKIQHMLQALHIDSIHLLYLHRFSDCKDMGVMQALRHAKCHRAISRIGISIYEPDELEYILDHLADVVDVVQLPYNLFDCTRWDEPMKRAVGLGIRIYARSVFLQGLFFCPPDLPKIKELACGDELLALQQFAKKRDYSMAELAITFVKGNPYISDYLVGCERVGQLQDNIRLDKSSSGKALTSEDLEIIHQLSARVSARAIDPRTW